VRQVEHVARPKIEVVVLKCQLSARLGLVDDADTDRLIRRTYIGPRYDPLFLREYFQDSRLHRHLRVVDDFLRESKRRCEKRE